MKTKQKLSRLAWGAALGLIAACGPTPADWRVQSSATAGTAIILRARGSEVRIACRRNPADVYVEADGLDGRSGDQMLTLRSGGHTVMLPVISNERGVAAAGPVTEPLLFMLNGSAGFEVEYGGRAVRTSALNETARNALAIACARAAGRYDASRRPLR